LARSLLTELLREGAAHLAEIRSDAPQLEAEHLLAHLLRIPRARLALADDAELTPSLVAAYRELLARRSAREPLQYVLGHTPFADLDLQVGPGVLIPRPETEVLVGELLREWRGGERSGRRGSPFDLIDVGTGSGAILYALLSALPEWRGLGVDRSRAALEWARRNRPTALRERASLVAGDLLESIRLPRGSVWIVAANLPYIPRGELSNLEPEVRDHEPWLALDGGPDGLDLVRRVHPVAAELLAPGGLLALELATDQPERVARELHAGGFFPSLRIYSDWTSRPRGVIARRG